MIGWRVIDHRLIGWPDSSILKDSWQVWNKK
jgi:hypothetical protein